MTGPLTVTYFRRKHERRAGWKSGSGVGGRTCLGVSYMATRHAHSPKTVKESLHRARWTSPSHRAPRQQTLPLALFHQAQPGGCMEHHSLNGYTHAHSGIVEIAEALRRNFLKRQPSSRGGAID